MIKFQLISEVSTLSCSCSCRDIVELCSEWWESAFSMLIHREMLICSERARVEESRDWFQDVWIISRFNYLYIKFPTLCMQLCMHWNFRWEFFKSFRSIRIAEIAISQTLFPLFATSAHTLCEKKFPRMPFSSSRISHTTRRHRQQRFYYTI